MEKTAKECEDLFYVPRSRKKIGNLNVNDDMDDNEMQKILADNMRHRQTFISSLAIPTYDVFKYVWYYDVLQMLT